MAQQVIRNVGLIGLGKMGRPMARLLVSRGFAVAGYDVSPEATKAVQSLGVKTMATPAEVAAASDLTIIVVGFDNEVMEAIFGDRGVLKGAHGGSIVAVASTVAPRTMKKIAARVAGKSVAFLDIPLCRGEAAAEDGKLLIMGGGDAEAFEACRPAFQSFADAVYHLGPLGSGEVGKMVNNLILWACISANYEGLKLAATLGVDPAKLREALLDSSAGNWALATGAADRPVPWAEKDMTIVLSEADYARLSLPLCGVVKEVMKGIKIERGLAMPAMPED
jgi:3-hydroxyisobutyrate dehydrogenase-like beta-hydroxyacid dehydrogenase